MNTIEAVKSRLMALCEEYEVFGDTPPEIYARADLVEHGLIDSMATVYLQEMIHEHFAIEMPAEVFALELRTLDSLVNYVHNATTA